jgi:hypothetical protein
MFMLALLAPCLGMQPAHAAPTLVRSNSAGQSSTTSISTSLAVAPTSGDLLILVCSTGLSRTVTTPAGFTAAKGESGTPTQYIFYKKSIGTETSATCTFNSSANVVIQYYEYSGMHGYMALDAVNTVSSTGSTTSMSSGTVTTTHANDLIFASVISDYTSTINTWSNAFTAREANGVQSGKNANRVWAAGADFIATGTGSYSTVGTTSNSGNWRGQIVAFRTLASPLLLSADIVDGSGASVANPTVGLSSLITGFGCQTSSGTLGTATQKIRIINNTDNPAWTLAMAATGGSSSVFTTGAASYQFNNPAGSGCNGGQMTVNVGSGSLSADAGCNTAGIALGSNSAFNQGVVDQITLATGNTSAPIDCAWNITNIPLSQKVPAEQKSGNYSINFTITLTAN